jgi:hypothetical protein
MDENNYPKDIHKMNSRNHPQAVAACRWTCKGEAFGELLSE